MNDKQVSDNQWQWKIDDQYYGVRLFIETATLIWSTWKETESGAQQFQPGTAQVFESYIAAGPPEGYHLSPEMEKEVLDRVLLLRKKAKKKRNLKDWLM